MATFHNLIVTAFSILHCTSKSLGTDRGAENSTGRNYLTSYNKPIYCCFDDEEV